jgi:hypothetical protein
VYVLGLKKQCGLITVENEEDIIQLYGSLFAKGNPNATKPNTWARVREIRSELTTDTENYPWRSSAEELWEFVSHFQNDELFGFERESEHGDNPLSSLNDCIEVPRYPPFEVIVAIAEAFNIYIAAQGKLTLEDAFFGPTKRGVGNYAARAFSDEKRYKDFHRFVSDNGYLKSLKGDTSDKRMNLEDKALIFLQHKCSTINMRLGGQLSDNNEHSDPETFLRGYRRWKKRTLK